MKDLFYGSSYLRSIHNITDWKAKQLHLQDVPTMLSGCIQGVGCWVSAQHAQVWVSTAAAGSGLWVGKLMHTCAHSMLKNTTECGFF